MKDYIKLLRVKHYIKNLLVFIPMFFGGAIFDTEKIIKALIGFICFCLISSSVYIINDIRDVEKDRNHPTKKNRPLASGRIKSSVAIVIMLVCLVAASIFSVVLGSIEGGFCLLLYFALNIAYNMGLKDKPIIDIVILASGFVIRVFYGGFITDIQISKWLYLVVTTGSLYMGLGKRRNELKAQTDTRDVLKHYNESFLDKNMYVCVSLTNVFYALWTLEMSNPRISWTIPVFIVMLMCYSLDAEGNSDGDPVEVILKNKTLISIIILYALCIFMLIYIF
ncbi:MAG: decaprenyl-phosphate phosphoribosyltransferase [Lachnospiraceae bacterium]